MRLFILQKIHFIGRQFSSNYLILARILSRSSSLRASWTSESITLWNGRKFLAQTSQEHTDRIHSNHKWLLPKWRKQACCRFKDRASQTWPSKESENLNTQTVQCSTKIVCLQFNFFPNLCLRGGDHQINFSFWERRRKSDLCAVKRILYAMGLLTFVRWLLQRAFKFEPPFRPGSELKILI